MLDTTHKRMDYLIREVAALPARVPSSASWAPTDPTRTAVRALAHELLGDDVLVRAVPHESIGDYYRAADVFARVATRRFGLAYVEALMHGLPIVASDTPVTRHVLGEFAILRDLSLAGEAARAIASALASPLSERSAPRVTPRRARDSTGRRCGVRRDAAP
jgi:glycosyltransferase involved in cell wall biosynthesis